MDPFIGPDLLRDILELVIAGQMHRLPVEYSSSGRFQIDGWQRFSDGPQGVAIQKTDNLRVAFGLFNRKRSANPPCVGYVGVLRRLYAAMAASVGWGAAVSPGAAGRQLCGSSVARSRCLSVGSRSNTSFR